MKLGRGKRFMGEGVRRANSPMSVKLRYSSLCQQPEEREDLGYG